MRAVYHPAVQKDVNRILAYYEAISSRLADELWTELLSSIAKIAERPRQPSLLCASQLLFF